MIIAMLFMVRITIYTVLDIIYIQYRSKLFGLLLFKPLSRRLNFYKNNPSAKLDTAQHWPRIGKNAAVERLPLSCRGWNDKSSMHSDANYSPNSGRYQLFSAQQRASAVPNSVFLTPRMVFRGKSDT